MKPVPDDARLTQSAAAALLGVHVSTVEKMVARGELSSLGRRELGRGALLRSEVERLAAHRAEQAKDRAARAAARQARARTRPRPVHGSPWLTAPEAAAVIGVSEQWIRRRAAAGTIPAVREGNWWFIRADHAELAANVAAADGPDTIAIALDGINMT